MVDPVIADPTPTPNPNTSDFDALLIPPLEQALFCSQELNLPNHIDNGNENGCLSFVGQNDVVVEDLDFDFTFTFDDLYLPSSDTNEFLNSNSLPDGPIQPPSGEERLVQYGSDCFNQTVGHPELIQISGDGFSEEDARLVLNSSSPHSYLVSGDQASDVDRYLNVPSPETGEFKHECSQESGKKKSYAAAAARALDCPWSESETHDREVLGVASSQGSGNCGSAVSETLNNPSCDSGNYARSASSSLHLKNHSKSGVVDHKIRLEESGSNCLLKRKKENEDVSSEGRSNKYQRSNAAESGTTEEEEKRKARLMRNRESAQLSRQRKKHYVEELEDKVRKMHSIVQDLNSKISYVMAENVTLRQQLGGGGMCPPPAPLPGVYPHPPMAPPGYPWMPYPPYVVKPQGSQVPLVPIPRLKPQQAASAPKAKKAGSKKTEVKTKKVASVSFLGLLFFIVLFGGLVPMVNVKYGVRETYMRGSSYAGNKLYDLHPGMVLMVDRHLNKTDDNVGIEVSHAKFGSNKAFSGSIPCGRGHLGESESNREQKDQGSHPLPNPDEFVRNGNSSEPLVASLYVPRNDKLVKIDGNLIIHSVLASEKAMASHGDPGAKRVSETGLAVPGNLPPAIPVPGVGMKNGRHPLLYGNPLERQRALISGSAGRDDLKSRAADGKLQQWFREGLAGPMLNSGMCTEVFQFDVSPAAALGAIVPVTSARNISAEHRCNSTELSKKRNRRILHDVSISLPGSSHNVSEENIHRDTEQGNLHGNKSVSSMVVSVLVDPRDGGDSDDGMMGPELLPRIFIVVLLDSVKYVTYSCMLPLKSTGPHLVTT